MNDKQYYANVHGIIEELLKNAAHSFGIDFERLNLTAIETTTRMKNSDYPGKVDHKGFIQTFPCPRCNAIAQTEKALEYHMSESHGIDL